LLHFASQGIGRRLGSAQVKFLFHKELFLAMAEPKQA
jgi:hypothetical protein